MGSVHGLSAQDCRSATPTQQGVRRQPICAKLFERVSTVLISDVGTAWATINASLCAAQHEIFGCADELQETSPAIHELDYAPPANGGLFVHYDSAFAQEEAGSNRVGP